jgi:hypothetical protein
VFWLHARLEAPTTPRVSTEHEDGEARAKIIRGYFLIERVTLLSKKDGFKFQSLPKAERELILANLDTCKDELLFAGLPYAERASEIRKRLVGE